MTPIFQQENPLLLAAHLDGWIRGIEQPAVPFEGSAQLLAAAHRLSRVTLVPYWRKL